MPHLLYTQNQSTMAVVVIVTSNVVPQQSHAETTNDALKSSQAPYHASKHSNFPPPRVLPLGTSVISPGLAISVTR